MLGTSIDFADNSGFRLDSADGLSSTGSPLQDHNFHVIIGRRIGSTAIQLRTDQPYAIPLARFFETREKRRLHHR
jgi:hypothetical protein